MNALIYFIISSNEQQICFKLNGRMNREKTRSNRLPCQKEKCCGMINQQQDHFLSVTSRGVTKSLSRKKSKLGRRQIGKSLLQESYLRVAEENKQFAKKLIAKKKKIESLKLNLQEKDKQLQRYQLLEKEWKHSKAENRERRTNSDKKQIRIIQESQLLAKETLEKYRKLEEEFSKYRHTAESKIDKLRAEKQKLITEGTEKTYSQQIEELKGELRKFKDDQLTASSMKNLHQPAAGEDKLKFEVSGLKLTINTLKTEISQLKNYNSELVQELKERTLLAQHKETELRNNLDAINIKINSWQREYNELKLQSSKWEEAYSALLRKYQDRKRKYKTNNEEWSQIFQEFLREVDKLKQELDTVSARNLKLIKMSVHNH